jgi:O-acetyl-ADP-ribose deacetylase (regulator of RNase III)
MGLYKEVSGDLIALANKGEFDVIAHGCNSHCTMGAGIAPQMAKAFGADKFKMEDKKYRGDINKLGTIDYEKLHFEDGKWVKYPDDNGAWVIYSMFVVNAYTQYNYGANHADGDKKPIDYEALTLCMRKINKIFKGLHVGLPLIGCGLAGGSWSVVKLIIQQELKDCDVTIVNYKK